MRDAAREGFATATDLADYLVRKGLPFRDAHEAVARAVREAESRHCDLAELPLPDLRGFSPLIDADVFDVLTLEGSVHSRDHAGGTSPAPGARRDRGRARVARLNNKNPGRTTFSCRKTWCVPGFERGASRNFPDFRFEWR